MFDPLIKLRCRCSYNHLGNNDGKNLSAPQQFRSKEISKSNVVDDMVAANQILFPNKVASFCFRHVWFIAYALGFDHL